jgi:hypothetical protein
MRRGEKRSPGGFVLGAPIFSARDQQAGVVKGEEDEAKFETKHERKREEKKKRREEKENTSNW